MSNDSKPGQIPSFVGSAVQAIEAAAEQYYGKRMGVVIMVFDFQNPRADYASNGDRADMITALIEFVGRQDPAQLKEAMGRWRAQQIYPGTENPT